MAFALKLISKLLKNQQTLTNLTNSDGYYYVTPKIVPLKLFMTILRFFIAYVKNIIYDFIFI